MYYQLYLTTATSGKVGVLVRYRARAHPRPTVLNLNVIDSRITFLVMYVKLLSLFQSLTHLVDLTAKTFSVDLLVLAVVPPSSPTSRYSLHYLARTRARLGYPLLTNTR